MIPFNKPYCSKNALAYINDACNSDTLSGNGIFTKKCHKFFEQRYGFRKCLLTTSGTDALEMCAMLCHLSPDDEVIIPSFTFVSTALAFYREKAKIVFADSSAENPNITLSQIEPLVTPRTKVICLVHYAGIACDMDSIMEFANEKGIIVVEDAAHSIDSYYKGKPLGSLGHLAAFSFHETKNISCGEGGMLVVNDEKYIHRADIIWEKGTNRADFYKGLVNKYGWCDTGSSFLLSELNAAFLWAQLEELDEIQKHRLLIWKTYDRILRGNLPAQFSLPEIPNYATNNAHIYYILCPSQKVRDSLIVSLREAGIQSTFHYLPLHSSIFYAAKHDGRELVNCDHYSGCILRLPLYNDLTESSARFIGETVLRLTHNK